MKYLMEDATAYFLELWQSATLADYGSLVLTVILLGWFIGRIGRKVGT